jgi:catechol 2,3-dioxygenase-like lactoylglutathione lyase family enzyme
MTDNQHLPTAQNVHHVGLTVPDLDKAVDFFVDAIGCDVLYRKGPFGDSDGQSMERRLDVHPDASASLAMLRCGPTMNLELFEWDAPDQDETPTKNSDIGAMHLALQVEEIDAAVTALTDRDDVTMLDGPHTNDDGPTAGLTYVYCRVEWGLYLELLETPDRMPYADDTDERLYGPAPSWTFRPDHSE